MTSYAPRQQGKQIRRLCISSGGYAKRSGIVKRGMYTREMRGGFDEICQGTIARGNDGTACDRD